MSDILLNDAKKIAAYQAVDETIQDNMIVGIGSGTTVAFAVDRLAQRVKAEGLNIICIPTGFQSRQLIIQNNLTLGSLHTHPHLDVAIDGADEVDAQLTLNKGFQGCLLQGKVVASCADQFVVICDFSKDIEQLSLNLTIEVFPFAAVPVMRRIVEKFGGNAAIRMAVAKMGPCVTDNGNFLLSWNYPDTEFDWEKVGGELDSIAGVVATGLFVKMATKVYFGMEDGSVMVRN